MVSGYAVRCRQLHKVFGTGAAAVQALRDINWDAPLGEMSMLVGRSGSGKTTLLSVICGLLEPSGGSVELLGQELAGAAARHAARFRLANIGFVFQQYNLLPALTAAENSAVPLLAAGIHRSEALDRARELLGKLGMTRAKPRQLSGGQQQRVAIARAMINSPRLIVCDEPTAALDAESGRAVMMLLSQIAVTAERAVLVVTHDNRIFEFAHSITQLEEGHIVERSRKVGPGTRHGDAKIHG